MSKQHNNKPRFIEKEPSGVPLAVLLKSPPQYAPNAAEIIDVLTAIGCLLRGRHVWRKHWDTHCAHCGARVWGQPGANNGRD